MVERRGEIRNLIHLCWEETETTGMESSLDISQFTCDTATLFTGEQNN